MSRGRGKIESEALRLLAVHWLSDLPRPIRARGLGTGDLVRAIWTDLKPGEPLPEPQRVSLSRALNRLAEQDMIVKIDQTARRNESKWRINPARVVIR